MKGDEVRSITHYAEDGPLVVIWRDRCGRARSYQILPMGKFGARMEAAAEWLLRRVRIVQQ